MKKRILFTGLILLAIAGWVVMPQMVESAIPTVYYVTPSLTTHENNISCSGTIQSQDVRQIYLQSMVVAEEVFVTVGDVVKEGDLLVKLDREKTDNLSGLPVSLIRDVSDDLTSAQLNGVDWAALASSYGLNAIVNGGSQGVDAALLEELAGQNGLLATGSGAILDIPFNGEIVAPISGVVSEVGIQKEIPAASGKAILTIADNQHYKVIVSVKEEDIGRVQLGDVAKVWGVGFSGTTYTGRITKIYPTARKTLSGTTSETVVDVEIALDNPDKKLKSGFTAKAEILRGDDSNLITVPYEAIRQDENNNEYVYLYEDGRLKKQVVTTGRELANEVEILGGISVNSVVVYNPSDAVREGAMIHIKGRADVSDDN